MAEIHPADNSAWIDASRYNDAEALLQVLLARQQAEYNNRTETIVANNPSAANPGPSVRSKKSKTNNTTKQSVDITSSLNSNNINKSDCSTSDCLPNMYSNKSIAESASTSGGKKKHNNRTKQKGNVIISEDSLAGQVQKARLQLQDQMQNVRTDFTNNPLFDRIAKLEQERSTLRNSLTLLEDRVKLLEGNLDDLMKKLNSHQQLNGPVIEVIKAVNQNLVDSDDEDAIDLFGSESEDEDEILNKVREERLAAYNAKKAKKQPLIAKSSIIFDVKPWDDETNMKELEKSVRSIQQDGLLWGASKLVPLAYGIHKLQINCVIEDDKVSVDALQEQIEQNGAEFVQSVDIAAFNKI